MTGFGSTAQGDHQKLELSLQSYGLYLKTYSYFNLHYTETLFFLSNSLPHHLQKMLSNESVAQTRTRVRRSCES